MALFKDGAFVADIWHVLGEAEDMPQGGQVIVPLARWRAIRAEQQITNVPLGVSLTPGDSVEEIVADLPRLSLIALTFPKYSDGRAFSMAHKLRRFYGFAGELRAIGDVLYDQLQLMERCGFDSFEITSPATLGLLESGRRPDLNSFYQPGIGPEVPVGTRPWARRRAM